MQNTLALLCMYFFLFETLWLYVLGLSLLPAVLQINLYPFYQDSPKRLLLTKHDQDKAKTSILFYSRQNVDMENFVKELRGVQKLTDQQIGLWYVSSVFMYS